MPTTEQRLLVVAMVVSVVGVFCFIFGIVSYLNVPNDRSRNVTTETEICEQVPAYTASGKCTCRFFAASAGTYYSDAAHGPADFSMYLDNLTGTQPIVVENFAEWHVVGDLCKLVVHWKFDGRFGAQGGAYAGTDEVRLAHDLGDLWPEPRNMAQAALFKMTTVMKFGAPGKNQYVGMNGTRSSGWGGPNAGFLFGRMVWSRMFALVYCWPDNSASGGFPSPPDPPYLTEHPMLVNDFNAHFSGAGQETTEFTMTAVYAIDPGSLVPGVLNQ